MSETPLRLVKAFFDFPQPKTVYEALKKFLAFFCDHDEFDLAFIAISSPKKSFYDLLSQINHFFSRCSGCKCGDYKKHNQYKIYDAEKFNFFNIFLVKRENFTPKILRLIKLSSNSNDSSTSDAWKYASVRLIIDNLTLKFWIINFSTLDESKKIQDQAKSFLKSQVASLKQGDITFIMGDFNPGVFSEERVGRVLNIYYKSAYRNSPSNSDNIYFLEQPVVLKANRSSEEIKKIIQNLKLNFFSKTYKEFWIEFKKQTSHFTYFPYALKDFITPQINFPPTTRFQTEFITKDEFEDEEIKEEIWNKIKDLLLDDLDYHIYRHQILGLLRPYTNKTNFKWDYTASLLEEVVKDKLYFEKVSVYGQIVVSEINASKILEEKKKNFFFLFLKEFLHGKEIRFEINFVETFKERMKENKENEFYFGEENMLEKQIGEDKEKIVINVEATGIGFKVDNEWFLEQFENTSPNPQFRLVLLEKVRMKKNKVREFERIVFNWEVDKKMFDKEKEKEGLRIAEGELLEDREMKEKVGNIIIFIE